MLFPKEVEKKEPKKKCRNNACMRYGNWAKGICPKCEKMIFGKKQSKRTKTQSKPKKTDWQRQWEKTKSAFQKLRRAECADKNGMVTCVVTGKMFRWDDGKRVHGGHFYGAHKKNTTFERMNVWPQAAMSNFSMGDGHQGPAYREFLIKKFGAEEVDKLRIRSTMSRKYAIDELKIMQEAFEQELERLIKEKKI